MFRENNPSIPFTEDQDLWEDVTFDIVLQLELGFLRSWAREGSPLKDWIELPREVWQSVHRHDVDWCRSSVPGLGLYCIVVAPANALPATASVTTVAAERRCKTALIALMANGSVPGKSKDEYRREFKIGARAFDRAWAQAVAETGNEAWSRPGRKSRRCIDTPV